MKKRVIDGVDVHRSSGNVFADLGLPDADKLKIKTGLIIEIRKAIRRQGLTQQEAATRMGITQPKVSSMMRGDFSNLSERKDDVWAAIEHYRNRAGDFSDHLLGRRNHSSGCDHTVTFDQSLKRSLTLLHRQVATLRRNQWPAWGGIRMNRQSVRIILPTP